MLDKKVYNNDDITFFSVYQRLPSPSVIMYCSHELQSNTLSHSGLSNVNIAKRMFYPPSVDPDQMQHYAAFHLGLHCLQLYSFMGFPDTHRLACLVLMDTRQIYI